jgi:hypothetical protein
MQVFSPEWFKHHQTKLVRFANTKVGKSVFGIPDVPVIGISPAGFSFIRGIDPKEGKLYCACHAGQNGIYANRLRKYGAPLWWTLHFMDWAVLDRQQLVPDFGFNTLTVNPGSGTSYCFDAQYQIYGVYNQNFLTLRAQTFNQVGAGGDNLSTALGCSRESSSVYLWSPLARMGSGFDTTSIPITAVVQTAIMNQRGSTGYASHSWWTSGSNMDLVWVPWTPDNWSSPASADADNFTASILGAKAFLGAGDGAWGYTTGQLVQNILPATAIQRGAPTGIMTMWRGDCNAVEADNPLPWGGAATGAIVSANFHSRESMNGAAYYPSLYAEYYIRVQINIEDAWKDVTDIKVNIGDAWKSLTELKINLSDIWKVVF